MREVGRLKLCFDYTGFCLESRILLLCKINKYFCYFVVAARERFRQAQEEAVGAAAAVGEEEEEEEESSDDSDGYDGDKDEDDDY